MTNIHYDDKVFISKMMERSIKKNGDICNAPPEGVRWGDGKRYLPAPGAEKARLPLRQVQGRANRWRQCGVRSGFARSTARECTNRTRPRQRRSEVRDSPQCAAGKYDKKTGIKLKWQ